MLFTQASCQTAVVTISIFHWHKGNTGGGTSPTSRFHLGKTVFVLMLNFPPSTFFQHEVRQNHRLKSTPEIKSTNQIHFFLNLRMQTKTEYWVIIGATWETSRRQPHFRSTRLSSKNKKFPWCPKPYTRCSSSLFPSITFSRCFACAWRRKVVLAVKKMESSFSSSRLQ